MVIYHNQIKQQNLVSNSSSRQKVPRKTLKRSEKTEPNTKASYKQAAVTVHQN